MKDKLTLKELHEVFLEMMEDFHHYCICNNLSYYMVGGTLLGAVRNRGFIPWDDDVDFAMPRPDYNRFIKIYNGKYKIEHLLKNKNYTFPYLKFFHPYIPIVHIYDEKLGVDSHVFLKFDIYPIDGLGRNKKIAFYYAQFIQKIRQLCYLNISIDKSQNKLKNLLLLLVRKIPSWWLFRLQETFMSCYNYDKSLYVTRWRMPNLSKNIVAKSVFGIGSLLDFEDIQLVAPDKYREYLTLVYGDYLTPIRENIDLRHDINSSCNAKKLTSYINNNV